MALRFFSTPATLRHKCNKRVTLLTQSLTLFVHSRHQSVSQFYPTPIPRSIGAPFTSLNID